MSGVEKTIIPMIKETTKLSYVLCIRSIVTGQQAEFLVFPLSSVLFRLQSSVSRYSYHHPPLNNYPDVIAEDKSLIPNNAHS
ncbi:Uncharacterized protein HZ326_9007 [Fusarium oxysporum f. sp. albedinis]|nr:Uncharacterized protein HZ326_9007 [Fusarium oxysporum f. sp. albedinis]